LFRRRQAHYLQDGHTQRVVLIGETLALRSKIEHDDRKPFSEWLISQNRYMRLEAAKLLSTPASSLKMADRVRLVPFLAPFLVAFYCLFAKGLIFHGSGGFYYTTQRVMAEFILSKHLIKRKFFSEAGHEPPRH
jgi:hypothetical protein